jgi:PTS system N-acetylglucosamine-specific IIC component
LVLNTRKAERHPLASIAVLAAVLSLFSVILIALRIVLFHGIAGFGTWLVSLDMPGTGLFALFNRLLAPFDLHRPLNYVILGEGGAHDMNYFWGQVTDGDPGKYMSGFFAPMMFGIPAACLYLGRHRSRTGSRAYRTFLLLTAVSAFSCGLCEPFEYWLLLSAPLVYIGYSVLFGISGWLSAYTGFRAGFACSGGMVDLIFSAAMPAACNAWLLIPLGLIIGFLFFLLFHRIPADNGAEFDIIEPDNREGVE